MCHARRLSARPGLALKEDERLLNEPTGIGHPEARVREYQILALRIIEKGDSCLLSLSRSGSLGYVTDCQELFDLLNHTVMVGKTLYWDPPPPAVWGGATPISEH